MRTQVQLNPRHLRAGAVAALSAVALAAPAAAQAGTVAVDRSCYTEGDGVTVGGTGFTPGSRVSISGAGFYGQAPVLVNGAFVYRGMAPLASPNAKPGSKKIPFTVTGSAGRSASGALRVAPLAVRLKPSRANPRRRVRWSFSGFPRGSKIYGHFSRGGRTSRHRFGRAHGPCGTLKTRARLLPIPKRRVHTGLYRVQIDTNRRLVTSALPRLVLGLRVYRIHR